jgi:hypothetical protein
MTLDIVAAFRAYLFAWTCWAGLGLGCMGLLFVQFLTGGKWGLATRRIFEAAVGTVPVMAVLFVPLLFGTSTLYAWARPGDVEADPVLQHRAIYLNLPFFTVRTVSYLVIWTVLAVLVRRWSSDSDVDSVARLRRLQKLSIIGVLALGLTVSFAAIDWLMSLDADWYSTMYPPLVGMSFLLAALAFGIVVLLRVAPRSELAGLNTPRVRNDVGSLLLAFLMLWAYMAYFQYMLIWAGNLSDEIPFYLKRAEGGWQPVAIGVAVLGFFVPFWFLLFRAIKRNPRTLASVAVLVLVMHVVDVYWLIAPPFLPAGPRPNIFDVLAVVVLGGVWLSVFAWHLRRRSLLARSDLRSHGVLEAAREAA